MTESLRQGSSIEINRPIRLLPNRVMAVQVQRLLSKRLWTPPEARPILADVVAVTPPRGIESQVKPGDRVVIPPHIGVEITIEGQPALICKYEEVLAVVDV